ncbi:LysR family transcriptional regulator [Halopseudomonas pachastrellae]|nr:LysR family transcriptional regulator [Halopseudomonas pachastrellae]
MDLRSLRYFCAAAEAGSLTAAAERCHVAQPSISNAVAQLEQEFALRLFSRSKKGVTLTPEGEAFYQEAARLLGSAGEMEQRFKRVERPRLSVGIDSSLASRDSGYLLQLTAGRLQNYRLHVRTQPTQTADLWLLSETAGAGRLSLIALLEQEYRLLLPRGWSLNQPLSWSRPSAIRGSTGSTASARCGLSGAPARPRRARQYSGGYRRPSPESGAAPAGGNRHGRQRRHRPAEPDR